MDYVLRIAVGLYCLLSIYVLVRTFKEQAPENTLFDYVGTFMVGILVLLGVTSALIIFGGIVFGACYAVGIVSPNHG